VHRRFPVRFRGFVTDVQSLSFLHFLTCVADFCNVGDRSNDSRTSYGHRRDSAIVGIVVASICHRWNNFNRRSMLQPTPVTDFDGRRYAWSFRSMLSICRSPSYSGTFCSMYRAYTQNAILDRSCRLNRLCALCNSFVTLHSWSIYSITCDIGASILHWSHSYLSEWKQSI
jgi:hypothetical protein